MDYESYREALTENVGVAELPFERAEYANRYASVIRRMDSAGIHVLLVTDPADICYLTGYTTFEVSVHACLIVHPGRTRLQVPSIEVGPAVCSSLVDDVVGYRWERPQEVIEQLEEAILEFSQSTSPTVGIDSWSATLRAGVLEALRQEIGRESFRDASGMVDDVKIVKSDAEIEVLRESARITGAGLDASIAEIREGALDNEVAAAGAAAMLKAGGEFMSMQPIVTAGSRSSVIHANHRRNKLRRGEPVFLEFGSAYQRYTAPMMRTAVVGEPTAKMREVFDSCRRIVNALMGSARPGNSFDTAAQAAEYELGELADEAFFSGVYGYTVGAQFPPSWIEGSGFIARGAEQRFEENMIFHLPICLRIPGQWGIGFSETIRIVSSGGEPITQNTWELKNVH